MRNPGLHEHRTFGAVAQPLIKAGGGDLGVQAQWTLASYVTFTTQTLIAFGLAFEIPVVLLVLGRLGIITSAWLRHYRRHALVTALVVGAVLTPPDVFSQMILAGPLILLYEACIWVVWSWERAARRMAGPVNTEGRAA